MGAAGLEIIDEDLNGRLVSSSSDNAAAEAEIDDELSRVVTRWMATSAALSGGLLVGSLSSRRRHGASYFSRLATVSSAVLLLQHAIVGWMALRQRKSGGLPPNAFGIADVLTLTRGAVAAHLIGIAYSSHFDRSDQSPGPGSASLAVACTALDWLDGPVARRFGGGSAWGRTLDLEIDSWLTLCAACAACASGQLPLQVLLAPALRYVLLPQTRTANGSLNSWWTRLAGASQMLLFVLSLTPMVEGRARRVVGGTAVPIATLSMASLMAQARAARAPEAQT